jgi:hypothetical protein
MEPDVICGNVPPPVAVYVNRCQTGVTFTVNSGSPANANLRKITSFESALSHTEIVAELPACNTELLWPTAEVLVDVKFKV